TLRNELAKTKFVIIKQEDITLQIVKALEKDSLRREDIIKREMPKFMWKAVGDFAGTTSSNTYRSFATGQNIYFFYVLQK
ncbi:MAG TPA: hypothetical protein DIT25_02070, partial [Candidatus Moranbacteria bacterium]|nr:hypothetical protein [Candidatus Moranbacteria bacterium]